MSKQDARASCMHLVTANNKLNPQMKLIRLHCSRCLLPSRSETPHLLTLSLVVSDAAYILCDTVKLERRHKIKSLWLEGDFHSCMTVKNNSLWFWHYQEVKTQMLAERRVWTRLGSVCPCRVPNAGWPAVRGYQIDLSVKQTAASN